MSKQAKPRNVATLLNRAKLEYLSLIVFHTALVAREYALRVPTHNEQKVKGLFFHKTTSTFIYTFFLLLSA